MSGIDKILPKSVIDEHLFEPCGYSANGLMPNVSFNHLLTEMVAIFITSRHIFSHLLLFDEVSIENSAP